METKKWYQSKAILGSIVSVIVMVLGMFGYGIGAEDQEHIINILLEIGGIVAAGFAVYGRIKASKTIKK